MDDAKETQGDEGARLSDGIGIGDKVVLLYADEQRRISVRLTNSANDLEKGLLSVASPLGNSVYGAEEGDEIEFQFDDGRKRKVLIESVEKAMRDDATAQLPETDTTIDLQGKVFTSQAGSKSGKEAAAAKMNTKDAALKKHAATL